MVRGQRLWRRHVQPGRRDPALGQRVVQVLLVHHGPPAGTETPALRPRAPRAPRDTQPRPGTAGTAGAVAPASPGLPEQRPDPSGCARASQREELLLLGPREVPEGGQPRRGLRSAYRAPPATTACRRLGCDYLLVLMNTAVFFILLKKSLLHIPWVAGVKAQVTTTKSDSSASLVSGTKCRNAGHGSARGPHRHAQQRAALQRPGRPFSTDTGTSKE